MRRLLWWTQRVLWLSAMTLLGYVGFVLADAWIFEWRARDQFDRDRPRPAASQEEPAVRPVSEANAPSRLPAEPTRALRGLLGRMSIPSLALSVTVVEGTDALALRRAVGHVPGTAMPGETGNVVISGHRDTHFRPLRNVRRGDVINIATLRGDFSYRVTSTLIVSPDHLAVLEPGEGENLTLITCYPFNFIGSAPDRFIVRAVRIV